jgi:hypothetical protein
MNELVTLADGRSEFECTHILQSDFFAPEKPPNFVE